MGLPFFVVVCWVFVAGDNSGFNLEQHMTRVEALEIIKLLSALESWSFSLKERLPTYLIDQIAASIEVLEKEVLK